MAGSAGSHGAGGLFVVAWESFGSDGADVSGAGILGQRLGSATIFADGFESGDTSAWSGAVP